jgi:erythromycin esterase
VHVKLSALFVLLAVQLAQPNWVRPIQSVDATDFGDLRFLRPILRDARIVQLGENGHGAAESMRLRARLVQFLHAEMGFTVVAFESSVFLCHSGDGMTQTAEPSSTLMRSLIGVWHTQEVLPIFAYMKTTRGSQAPLRLAGFDIQPIGSGRKERPAFFERVVGAIDPRYAQEVLDLDRRFNAEYEKGTASRRAYFRANVTELAQAYGRLAQFIDRHLSVLQEKLGREDPLVARQEARSMSAYVRQQAAAEMKGYAELRDKAMADNLAFITDELFPGQKIVVWGHNYHLRHDNAAIPPTAEIFPGVQTRSMGSWVRERYSQQVYTIGQYELTGEVADNSRKPYTIGLPADGSLEQRLNTGMALSFVDLRTASRERDGRWLAEPTRARYNGQYPELIVPVNQFDGLLMIAKVSAPHYLYP